MASEDKTPPLPPEILYESLHFKLMGAAQLLDGTTERIRQMNLNPDENVRRVADALLAIFLISKDIYEVAPGLAPTSVTYKPPEDQTK